VNRIVPPTAVLTRPAGRNEALAIRLREAGWQVHEWPALHIEPIPEVVDAVPLPGDFDLAVFVSGNAAALYLRQLHGRGLRAWPVSCVAAAVGPATAGRLLESGWMSTGCAVVHPAAQAPRHDSEALWDCLRARGALPRRVLLVRGAEGRDWLAERLREHGAQVTVHSVYRRSAAPWDAAVLAQLAEWHEAGHHPAWLLTSAESIDAVRANVARAASLPWWQACSFVVTHARLVPRLALPAPEAAHDVRICVPADDAIFSAFVSG
jgi:uroporphyrinogen-III synthase